MRQELSDHANRPAQIDFNLASDVFEASSLIVNIDLTHDAGVVDQNVDLGKLFGDLFVKSGDRFRIGHVASKGVSFWKGRFRTVHLSLIAARDKNRVAKCRELFGELVTDAAGAAGDQDRIAREFHNLRSLGRCLTDSRIVGIAAWSRRVDGFPVDFGKRSAGCEPLNQVGIGEGVRTRPSSQAPRRSGDCSFGGHTDVGDQAFDGPADAAFLASPLPSKSASNVRARKAGTRAFMMRFSRPGTTLERLLRRPLRASDTHCSTLIGFNGMVFVSKPNFPNTAVSVNPAASTVTQTPRGLNS